MGHEFVVAAQRADETEEEKPPVELDLKDEDGEIDRTITCYFPGEGQVMAFMASNASFSADEERIAGAINFFVSLLEKDDHSYVVNRMFDRNDPFGGRHITGLISIVMEQWSGRPTGSSSGSTPSRRNGGRKSTAKTPALTP
jgi:hypothetical protein